MNTQNLLDLAELALAGYGQFNVGGRPPRTDDLENLNGDPAGFSKLQADRFSRRFNVAVPTFEDAKSAGGSGRTSFDVTVFVGRVERVNLDQIFISFRGTGQQDVRVLPNDIESALQNGSAGAASSNFLASRRAPRASKWDSAVVPSGTTLTCR